MTRVLGIDGGQSGIRLRTSDDDRVVEVEGVSRQEGDPVLAVADAVERGWREGAFGPVDRVVLGLTTAPTEAVDAARLCGLIAAVTGSREVWLADDAVTSHAGALGFACGVTVTAGTGVACLAVSSDGRARIVGGHGFLVGDEGGGFWIGARGLNAVLRAAEGRGPATSLAGPAERAFGPIDGLAARLHDTSRPVDAIARFAPAVLAEAAGGDPVAASIVDDAATELLGLVAAGAAWAAGPQAPVAPPVPVALGGRLLGPETELRRRLDVAIPAAGLRVAPGTADGSSLDGAIRIGLAAGLPFADLVHRWPGAVV